MHEVVTSIIIHLELEGTYLPPAPETGLGGPLRVTVAFIGDWQVVHRLRSRGDKRYRY